MTAENIYNLCNKAPCTKVVAIHMEAWNHCTLTRLRLKEFLEKHRLNEQVYVPDAGEYRDY